MKPKLTPKEQGKKNRAAGQRFELKTRKDLESQGWVCDRWNNNVKDGKLAPAKSMFNMRSTGFPDIVAFRQTNCGLCQARGYKVEAGHEIVGVECKSNGYLTKKEKEKCDWLIENKIFKIFIASKSKKRGEIIYKKWELKK